MASKPTSPSETAREILLYLRDHPEAKDTIEAIAEWWLMERRIKTTVQMVKAAIEELEGEQMVQAMGGTNGQKCYGLNPAMGSEIEAALRPSEEEGDP